MSITEGFHLFVIATSRVSRIIKRPMIIISRSALIPEQRVARMRHVFKSGVETYPVMKIIRDPLTDPNDPPWFELVVVAHKRVRDRKLSFVPCARY